MDGYSSSWCSSVSRIIASADQVVVVSTGVFRLLGRGRRGGKEGCDSEIFKVSENYHRRLFLVRMDYL